MDNITYNSAGQPLPWETKPMQEPEDLHRLKEPVKSPADHVTGHVKPIEPPRKSLAWMQLHMREFFTLRAGRTYKPAPDPVFERQITEAEAIFAPKQATT